MQLVVPRLDDKYNYAAAEEVGTGPMLSSLAVASSQFANLSCSNNGEYDDDTINSIIQRHASFEINSSIASTDQEVEHETAVGLVKTILNSLQLQPQMNGGITYRCRLNNEQGLHIAILASSLSMALRCCSYSGAHAPLEGVLSSAASMCTSTSTLSSSNHENSLLLALGGGGNGGGVVDKEFQDNLLLALQKVSDLFAVWDGDITIQQVVLDATVKITNSLLRPDIIVPPSSSVSKHQTNKSRNHGVNNLVSHLLDFLFQIVNGNVSANIRLEAAVTIVKFLLLAASTVDDDVDVNETTKTNGTTPSPSSTTSQVLSKVEANASSLISTLSTVSLSAPSNDTQSSEYLYQLADMSNVLLSKMAKRRGTILVVVKDLIHEDEDIRESALQFCASLLKKCPESIRGLTTGLEGNADLLIEALTNCAQDEPESSLRLMAISLLRNVVNIKNLRSESAMNTLRSISENGDSDEEIVLAATAYCLGTRNCPYSLEMLATTVDFTTFPYDPVRSEALATLEAITFDPACVSLLMDETDILERFALIIQHGSHEDCTNALNIARQVARSISHHEALCSHSNFLGAAIELVAREKTVNAEAHSYGVELLLSLLSNETNTAAFLSFSQLLPWLVTFVATTGDEDFKQEVIPPIVRLSEALLE